MRNIIYPKKETWPEILKRPTQTVKEIENKTKDGLPLVPNEKKHKVRKKEVKAKKKKFDLKNIFKKKKKNK